MGTTMLFGCPPNLPWWRLQSMSDAEIAAYNRSFMVEVKMSVFGNISDRTGNESDLEYNRRKNRENDIWNAAIEAAADLCTHKIAIEIRKLKK